MAAHRERVPQHGSERGDTGASRDEHEPASVGSEGNVNEPIGPSTSTSLPGSSVRCGPGVPSAPTPTNNSMQSLRRASSGDAAMEYGRLGAPFAATSTACPGT